MAGLAAVAGQAVDGQAAVGPAVAQDGGKILSSPTFGRCAQKISFRKNIVYNLKCTFSNQAAFKMSLIAD